MGAVIRDIKLIKKDLSDRIQMLNTFVFGNKEIYEYNENVVYKIGDFIKRLNSETNEYEILQCVNNNTTGPFDPDDWKNNIVGNFTSGQDVNYGMIKVSDVQPSEPNNIVWWDIKNIKDFDNINLGNNNLILISSSNQIIAQDEKPEHDDTKVWFDFEPFDN